MECYANLTPTEILKELIKYKQNFFSWFSYGMYGEEINIHSPDENYNEDGLRKLVDFDFKLEFNNKSHLRYLRILDLYYLLDNEGAEDFRNSLGLLSIHPF